MQLKEINSLLSIDIGAPAPVIVANEHQLVLLYYYDKSGEVPPNGYHDFPKERSIEKDTGIAQLTFKGVLIHKFGYPNDEVLMSHPYSSLGLTSYGMFEVEDSDWIIGVEKMNRIHPFHKSGRFKSLKHYIITFKDSTFECIAENVDLRFTTQNLKEVLNSISASFN